MERKTFEELVALGKEDRSKLYEYITNLTDALVIEQVLSYGEPDDILNLKKHFKYTHIKQVWQNCLLPDNRFKNSNVWLAKVFFNIRQTNKYIAKYSKLNNRDGHLRLLAAQN